MKTPIELRKKITAAGKWKDFTVRKDMLKLEGVPSGEASRQAILEFEDGTLPEVDSTLNHQMLMNKVRAGEEIPYVKPQKPVVKVVAEEPEPKATEKVAVSSEELSEMEKLQERRAGEVEIFRWVARNMEFDPAVSDCPDPTAWALLKQCHSSKAFRLTFWTTMYVKLIPTRSKLEGVVDAKGDGAEELELLGQIEAASLEAMGGE